MLKKMNILNFHLHLSVVWCATECLHVFAEISSCKDEVQFASQLGSAVGDKLFSHPITT